jgi:hypothetical protein
MNINNPAIRNSFDNEEDQKNFLSQSTDRFKQALENQLQDFRKNAGHWARTGLVVGGVLVLTYVVARKIFSDKKSKKAYKADGLVAESKQESLIVSMIKSSIATFLLSIAREKIIQFIEQMNQKNAAESDKDNISAPYAK